MRFPWAQGSKPGEDASGLEALRDEEAIETPKFPIVRNALSSSQPLLESCREQCVGIEILKRLVDGSGGDGRGDPCRLDLPADARLPAAPHAGFHAGDHAGHARIVDAAVGLQAGDGLINGRRVVLAAGEALAYLRLRKLPPRQHPERGEVGGRPRCQTS
jgi:hypothetical protein